MDREMNQQPEIPEYYADNFMVTAGAYTVAMSFGLSSAHPTPGQPPRAKSLAVIRMSPEHAKILTMVMRQHLKHYEREASINISIPHAVYAQLGVSPEDW